MEGKVCKFGGSSVADAEKLRRVKAIVLADPERTYIVPSAPGRRGPDDEKVTDVLYRAREQAAAGADFSASFGWIAGRFLETVRALDLSIDLRPELEQIRERIAQGASADYVASRGEYLSGLVLAAWLGFEFVDAAEVIRFDATGRFEVAETQAAVSKRLSSVSHAVIPGFYGAKASGEIVTFSRGGSDVTGAIIARGVRASEYENWTDVSGVLMADPRIVASPQTVDTMTYRELRELAYMGATVLHDEAIFPVREAGIPVRIRNTNDPDHPGTEIVRTRPEELPASFEITGIAGRKDFTIIAVEKTLMNSEVGFASRMLRVLEARGIAFEHLPSGIDTMSLVIETAELRGQLDDVVAEIETACNVDWIGTFPDIALIATVGRGMSYNPGIAARLFSALARARINVRMIDQGSSELNIIVGVQVEDFEEAIRAIYAEFVGKDGSR